jgi:aspartate-semialdehyde dehydrogenase
MAVDMKADIAFFSAGGETSLSGLQNLLLLEQPLSITHQHGEWILLLIVPEINASLTKEDKIIANPNCSTIQMVLVLAFT